VGRDERVKRFLKGLDLQRGVNGRVPPGGVPLLGQPPAGPPVFFDNAGRAIEVGDQLLMSVPTTLWIVQSIQPIPPRPGLPPGVLEMQCYSLFTIHGQGGSNAQCWLVRTREELEEAGKELARQQEEAAGPPPQGD